jgi:hypothetical protein
MNFPVAPDASMLPPPPAEWITNQTPVVKTDKRIKGYFVSGGHIIVDNDSLDLLPTGKYERNEKVYLALKHALIHISNNPKLSKEVQEECWTVATLRQEWLYRQVEGTKSFDEQLKYKDDSDEERNKRMEFISKYKSLFSQGESRHRTNKYYLMYKFVMKYTDSATPTYY